MDPHLRLSLSLSIFAQTVSLWISCLLTWVGPYWPSLWRLPPPQVSNYRHAVFPFQTLLLHETGWYTQSGWNKEEIPHRQLLQSCTRSPCWVTLSIHHQLTSSDRLLDPECGGLSQHTFCCRVVASTPDNAEKRRVLGKVISQPFWGQELREKDLWNHGHRSFHKHSQCLKDFPVQTCFVFTTEKIFLSACFAFSFARW